MTNLIEHADNGNTNDGNDKVVRIGESNAAISVKMYQDVYHQITGRTEQIRKRYSDNLLIQLTELEQLHHKVMQLCDIHTVVASNEVVSVFHEKDRKEQFTSFERFLAYNANTASPTVNIVLKYNFSIIPSGLPRPQEYVVTIRLTNRVAVLNKAEEDAPSFMIGRIFTLVSDHIAEITIDYADYVVARGFLEAFEEWVRGCNSIPKKPWLRILRRWSHVIPSVLRLAMMSAIVLFALHSIPSYFNAGSRPELWARFLVLYSGASYVLVFLARAAGELIENAIDSYPVLSYLKLNKGDSKLIENFERSQQKVVRKFVAGAVLSIALEVLASQIDKLI